MKKFFIFPFLMIFSFSSYSTDNHVLDFSNRGITDDVIANSIKSPAPPSVTRLIEVLKNHKDIEKLNLSGNNICLQGGIQILDFIPENLKKLQTLDLSFNRFYDWRDGPEYKLFEEKLLKVLSLSHLQIINLEGNPLFYKPWLTYMSSKAKEKEIFLHKLILN